MRPLPSAAAAALLGLLAATPVATAHAAGQLTCIDAVGASHAVTSFGTGAAPWAFALLQSGSPVSRYVGGQTYTLQVSGAGLGGFIISGFKGTPTSVGSRFTAAAKAGLLQPTDALSQQMQPPGCQTGVTHTSADLKSLVTLTWTAPAAGTGNVTFFGILLADSNSPAYRVYLLVSEGVAASTSSTAAPTPSLLAATGTPTLSGSSSSTAAATASATAASTRSSTAASTQSSSAAATSSATAAASASPTAAATQSTTAAATSSVTAASTASTTAASTPSTTAAATSSGTASPTPSAAATGSSSPTGSGTTTQSATASPTASSTRSSTWTPSGTASPSSTASSRATSTPTLSMGASASGTATGTASPSRSTTPSSSRSGTGSQSRTVTPSPSRSGTRSASRSGTPSSSRSATASSSRTTSPSGSRSGTPSRSVTATQSVSAAGTSTGSRSGTPSSTRTGTTSPSPQTGTPSPSGSPTAAPSESGSPTGTPSGAPTSASPPPASSSSATVTGTPSSSSSPATGTPAHAVISPTATPSRRGVNATATAGPSSGGSYAHSIALDSVMLLRWTLRAADGAVDFQLQATGARWLSLAPSPGHTDMVHGGVAVVGTPGDGDGAVRATLMRSQLQAELYWDAALLAAGTTNARVVYDAGRGVTLLSWTRALGGSGKEGDVDLSLLISTPALFIWGYGYLGSAWSVHQQRGATAVLLYPEGCNRNATCHGRGECAAAGAGATCACDIGYSASDACASCAPMFSPTAGTAAARPTCVLLDATLAVGGFNLSVSVGLLPAYATIGDASTGAAFVSVGDLAAALAAEIAVATAVDPALVTVRVGALAGTSSGATASNATVTFAPPRGAAANSTVVGNATRALIAAIGDPNSDLRNNGPAGFALNPAVAPAVAPVFVPLSSTTATTAGGGTPPPPFTARLLTADGVATTLTWYLEDAAGAPLSAGADAAAVAAGWVHGELAFPGDAWFGIGFGRQAAMVPADGIACEPPPPAAALGGGGAVAPPGAVHAVLLGGYVAAACPTVAPASLPPADGSGVPPAAAAATVLDAPTSVVVLAPGAHGGSVCRFRRRVAGGAALANGTVAQRPLVDGSPVFLTFAHGAPGVRALSSHAARHAGAVIVDFVTGAVRPLPPPPNYAAFTAHALAGAAAMLVLLPASIIAARYYRRVGAATPHSVGRRAVWFRAQALSLGVAVVAALVALALGVASTESRAAAASGGGAPARHFTDAHGVLGLLAVVLLAALPAAACAVAPHPRAAPYFAAARSALAVGALAAGVAAVFTGIYSAPSTDSVRVVGIALVAVWVVLVAATAVAHELRAHRRQGGPLLRAAAPGGDNAKGRFVATPITAVPLAAPVLTAAAAVDDASPAVEALTPPVLHIMNPMPSSRRVTNPLMVATRRR